MGQGWIKRLSHLCIQSLCLYLLLEDWSALSQWECRLPDLGGMQLMHVPLLLNLVSEMLIHCIIWPKFNSCLNALCMFLICRRGTLVHSTFLVFIAGVLMGFSRLCGSPEMIIIGRFIIGIHSGY